MNLKLFLSSKLSRNFDDDDNDGGDDNDDDDDDETLRWTIIPGATS